MGFVSNKVKRHELKRGDHIYTYRTGFIYAHHGIFVGDNRVIHFTSSPSNSSFFSSSSSSHGSRPNCTFNPTSQCGYMAPERKSAVVSSCLNCFLKKGSIYRFEYGVRKTVTRTRIRGGSCSSKHEDPPEETVRRAEYLLDKQGFGDYHLRVLNCENFASFCKTSLVHKKKGQIGECGQLHSGVFGIPNKIGKGCNLKSADVDKGTKVEEEELPPLQWDSDMDKETTDGHFQYDSDMDERTMVKVEDYASFLKPRWSI